jgi:hypothetical protein
MIVISELDRMCKEEVVALKEGSKGNLKIACLSVATQNFRTAYKTEELQLQQNRLMNEGN